MVKDKGAWSLLEAATSRKRGTAFGDHLVAKCRMFYPDYHLNRCY